MKNMLSKFSNLSKNDKKLIMIVSSITAALVIAVACVAIFVDFAGDNGEYTAEQNSERYLAVQDEALEFSAAPAALDGLTIQALSQSDFGTATDSKFLITSETLDLSVSHLNRFLSVRSGEDFTIEESDEGFVLSFNEELEPDRIVNLIYQPPGYAPASHAFQTADIFRITATSPDDNTHGIPTNAGIEITFSQELSGGMSAFRDALVIDPPAGGRIGQRGNTYIFMPHTLERDTGYTVTVKSGLAGISGESITDEHTFSFRTMWGTSNQPQFSVSRNAYETFLPWNEVFIAVSISSGYPERDFTVDLYDLKNHNNFINFTGTDSGELFESFDLQIQEFKATYDTFYYLFLGRTLPEGYYVAEIRCANGSTDITAQKFIQVSPISVYSLSLNDETVFWINDAATGEPAYGARVVIDGEASAVNDDGIVIVQPVQKNRSEITVEYGDYLPFAYVKPTFGSGTLLPSGRFLSYMYTDRPRYRPNDTIDVFGVIMPRYGHAHSPDDVFTLRIGDMIQTEIELDSHNSFAVRVPVTNMYGSGDIRIDVNGERLMSSWVNFVDYTNRAYILSGELDKIAYELDDYAEAEILITTYTGRPVEGVNLNIWNNDIPNLRTDENGIAAGRLPVTRDTHRSDWHPYWTNFVYSTVSDAQISQSVNLRHIVVPRNVMLEHELIGDTITVKTSEILAERINEEYRGARATAGIDRDVFRGAPVDIDFEIQITRRVTTRTVSSIQYDHINRRSVTSYSFDTTQDLYRTVQGRTVNGTAEITGLPVSDDPLISYSMQIHYLDKNGRETGVWIWGSNWWFYEYPPSSNIRYFSMRPEKSHLGIGETTRVSLREHEREYRDWWYAPDENPETPEEGRMLVVFARDKIRSANTGSPQGVDVTLHESAISSAVLFGAYFDGTYIYSVPQTYLYYDPSEREMEIELDFCGSEYKPGDEVRLRVKTSAAAGVIPAQVLISVVDESSTTAYEGRNANFLRRLYGSSHAWAWNYRSHVFVSHTQHNFGGGYGGGAEGGGGDDEGDGIYFRDFFTDNPVFEIIKTGADGTGEITFTLPDQLTSWRVTAIGLTEDGFAGDTRENIVSSLDFYADLIYTSEYIVGDDIAAVARAYGAGSTPADFTFNILQGDDIIFTDSQTGRRIVFNAGKLPAGEYKMQITVRADGYSDAVEHPFTVTESAMIILNRVTGEVSPDGARALPEYNMRDFPVRITLTNANIRPLTQILSGASNRNSFRTDDIAAAAFREYFFTGETDVLSVRSRVHARNGGIPELTYEAPCLLYTARFAASFPEYTDSENIKRFVRSELSALETRERRAAALLAMAAIGEPVLLQIREEVSKTNSDISSLYLAAALVAIGDDTGARDLMDLIEISAESELTKTLIFFINTAINPEAAWEYVQRPNNNRYVSDVAERINFVRRVHFLGGTISEVRYFLDGTTHTERLENFSRLHFNLSKEQFDLFNLTPVRGDTKYHMDFYGYDSSNWDESDKSIGISRRIEATEDLHRITIEITANGARGDFTIYDRLPSNMRFVPVRQRFTRCEQWFFVHNTQRQLVELNFFTCMCCPQPRVRTLTYHAMELYEADMDSGTSYVINRRNDLWGSTR
jgi:hypothetical protein